MDDGAPDLFGYTPAQGDLFAGTQKGWQPPPIDTAMIRKRLGAMLSELRGSRAGSPWNDDTMRRNQLVFPQMTNWLPPEEGEQLRLEFQAELQRLDLAA